MLKIKWLGQSGYILNDGTTEICIDPYLSDSVNRIAGRPRLRELPIRPQALKSDVLICTHNHLDHLDIDAIPMLNKENMLFLAPKDCEKPLKELGVTNFRAFDEGESVNAGEFKLTAVFAEHTVPAIGVLVENSGQKLYFAGDTLYNDRLLAVKCDILFICINGKLGNMNAEEAIRVSKMISPKTAVPNHYDMFSSNWEDPEKFGVENRFIMEFNKEYEVKNGCLI